MRVYGIRNSSLKSQEQSLEISWRTDPNPSPWEELPLHPPGCLEANNLVPGVQISIPLPIHNSSPTPSNAIHRATTVP
ncbi:hypothetical protein F2Q68_00006541 [Brassica cretica]|uniref:Uncharacterized protein n=1 Tax=Brassica cretica TaxID=69181 RepID=A0A8S9NQR6_BRACR|nr:hypothetical protein F2Q68_00006541 [Brassica cretica]KAF3507368.1 hypothetical protein F2Q69_00009683 [Brassica cretica]